jgi:hypothetical protein
MTPPRPQDPDELALAELTQVGMTLVRDLQARALAAESAADAADIALAFQRVSRSVRQSIALKARLERDRHRQAREDLADAALATGKAVERRRTRIRLAVERAIWDEAEGEEAERLLDDLDDALETAVLDDDFTLTPVAAQIDALRADLGLSAPGEAAGPDADPYPARLDWRSSA